MQAPVAPLTGSVRVYMCVAFCSCADTVWTSRGHHLPRGARIWTYSLSCYPCSLTCETLYLASFGIQFDVFSAQRLESLWWLLCCLLTSCICQTVCYGLSVRPCGMAGSPAVGLAWCESLRGKVCCCACCCMLLHAASAVSCSCQHTIPLLCQVY